MSTVRVAVLLTLCAAFVVAHAGPIAGKAEAPKVVPALPTEQEIADELDRVVAFEGIDDPNATIKEVIEFLNKQKILQSVPVSYSDLAFRVAFGEPKDVMQEAVGVVRGGRMTVKQVLQSALNKVNVPGGATFLVRRGSLEITTWDAVHTELGIKYDEKAISTGHRNLTVLHFMDINEKDLSVVLKQIAERTGVTILIDPKMTEKAKTTPIQATFRNVAVPTALELLADMAGLAVARKANVYYITTPDKAVRFTGSVVAATP